MPVDKQGNQIPQSRNGLIGYRKSIQFFYSPNNELQKTITIKDEGQTVTTTTTTYCYDAFGRRIGKTTHIKHSSKLGLKGKKPSFGFVSHTKTQTNATLMLWDGNRQFQEYTDTHIFTTIYEQNSFEPVARIVGLATHLEQKRLADIARKINRFVRIGETDEVINQRIADNSKPLINIYHYHNNHLGTPQELTNEQGDVIWLSYDYAWGGQYDTFYKTQAIGNYQIAEHELQPIRFQGQMLDIETGLHYNRFRYYDSDVGMFIQRDPIGLLGGVNVFAYAPNPIHWVDVFGLARSRLGQYDVFGEAILPKNMYKCSDAKHFQEANRQLYYQMKNNPNYRNKLELINPNIFKEVSPGKRGAFPRRKPTGFTWHHHPTIAGLLQLVDEKDHNDRHKDYHPLGFGGRKAWGGGTNCR